MRLLLILLLLFVAACKTNQANSSQSGTTTSAEETTAPVDTPDEVATPEPEPEPEPEPPAAPVGLEGALAYLAPYRDSEAADLCNTLNELVISGAMIDGMVWTGQLISTARLPDTEAMTKAWGDLPTLLAEGGYTQVDQQAQPNDYISMAFEFAGPEGRLLLNFSGTITCLTQVK